MRTSLLLTAGLALAGCGGDPTGIPSDAVFVSMSPLESTFHEVHLSSGIPTRERRVIRTSAEWEEQWLRIWGEVQPIPAPPEIDFAESMVLMASSGGHPTGGYGVQITRVALHEGQLLVEVLETEPGSGCSVTQSPVRPVTAVQVARYDEVAFVEIRRRTDC